MAQDGPKRRRHRPRPRLRRTFRPPSTTETDDESVPERKQKAATELTGPFLSPGSLTAAERMRLIDGIERCWKASTPTFP